MTLKQNDPTTATITPGSQAALRGFARHSTCGRTLRSLRSLASLTGLLMANPTRSYSRKRYLPCRAPHGDACRPWQAY
jgi:hypothetical protein